MLLGYKKVIVSFADVLGWLNWADDSIVEKAIGHSRFSYRAAEKRAFDLLLSVVATVFFFPLFLAIALALLLSGGGPLFEKSRSVGLNGRVFTLLNFRTKKRDGETFTTVGRFLNRCDLDALPNLLNVVRGDMSFVGPRPLSEEAWRKSLQYSRGEISDWLSKRNRVRPGLTGLALIASPWSELSFQELLTLDIYYIANSSIWIDLYILVRTAGIVLTSPGSLDRQARFSKVTINNLSKNEILVRNITVLVNHKRVAFTYDPEIGWHLEKAVGTGR
jgi:lipopolysaccharide/colanic/teichoic acid biosynthesis glycosyltransferase